METEMSKKRSKEEIDHEHQEQTLESVIQAVKLRFKSGNSIPVERAAIKASEWDVILKSLKR